MKVKLTKRIVEAITPDKQDQFLRDTELPGFGCKITPKGRRSYFLYYRTKDHRERRPLIGVHGAITCEQAREIARQWLSEIAAGGDPSGEQRLQRKAENFSEFSDRYMEDYAPTRKRPSTIETDRINLKGHILPALGSIKVAAITRTDVVGLNQSMKATPGAASQLSPRNQMK